MKIKVIGKKYKSSKYYQRQAASLDHAYETGLFEGSMTRYELMDRVTKYNPQLRWHANATHRGLFDSNKQEGIGFICGIGHNMTIPKYTISVYDHKKDEALALSTPDGDIVEKQIYNRDRDKGKILMRGWPVILNMVKAAGYRIDDEDLIPY